MAKFCANCGAQMDENAPFCPSCGAKQEISQQAAPKKQFNASAVSGKLISDAKAGNKNLCAIGTIILAMITLILNTCIIRSGPRW